MSQGSSMFLHWPYTQNYPLPCCPSTHCRSSQSCSKSCSRSCSKSCYSTGIGQHCYRDWCKTCNKHGNGYSFYPHSTHECSSSGTLGCEPISEEDCWSNMCPRRRRELSNHSLKCNVSCCSHSTCSNQHSPHSPHRKEGQIKRAKRPKVRNKLKRTLSRMCGTESSYHPKSSSDTSPMYGDADRTICSQTDVTECFSSTVIEALGVDSEGDARPCSETVLSTIKDTQSQSVSKTMTSCIRNDIGKSFNAQCVSSSEAIYTCMVQASSYKPKCTSKAEKAEQKRREMQQLKRDDRLFRQVIGFPCAGSKPSRTKSIVCCKDSLEIIGKTEIKNKNRGFRRFLSSLLCNSSCMECKSGETDRKCTCTPAEKKKKIRERLIEEDRIFRKILGFPFQRTFTTS